MINLKKNNKKRVRRTSRIVIASSNPQRMNKRAMVVPTSTPFTTRILN